MIGIVIVAQFFYLGDAKARDTKGESESRRLSPKRILALLPTGAGIYILGVCAFLSFVPEGSILEGARSLAPATVLEAGPRGSREEAPAGRHHG